MVEGLCELDVIVEERSLTRDERLEKEAIFRELEMSIILEEVSWRQKSRALWLREGDNNTRFFHRLANLHRRNNSVESLVVNGTVMSDSVEIKEPIVNFYKSCILKNICGDQSWMAVHSVQLMWRKEIGWKENLRTMKWCRW